MNKIFTEPATEANSYYYLWHLVALGVIVPDETEEGFGATLWDKLFRKDCVLPARVAMIDVGCCLDHPNLKGRVDAARSIDFTSSPYGTRLKKHSANKCQQNFLGLNANALALDGLSKDDLTLLEEIIQQLENSKGQMRDTGDVESLFASHGTAVSGLIVGGPETCLVGGSPSTGVIPYLGVDPFSELISIRTGFDNDPLQFISALLYAWHQKSDVIVMPRGLPDPDQGPSAKDDFKGNLENWGNREAADLIERIECLKTTAERTDPTSPHLSATGQRLWRIVKSLFVAISNHIPIVCAAGNEGESQLLYPANLANRENGVIAVGAVSGHGYRSGYSNYGEGLTIVAPSDDMVVFNRHQLRDTQENKEKLGYLLPEEAEEYPFCPMWLLSTDIPGRFGYDVGGEFPSETEDRTARSGFYTQFGGTSGACALVGGVIALIRRAERIANKSGSVRDGRDIKALLIKTARTDILIGRERRKLQVDAMNAPNEDAAPFELFFGSGLVDARAAVETILP